MVTIVESGMTFGPHPDDHCFYIEKSNAYMAIQNGVQMAEFLLLHSPDGKLPFVWVVEAKQSSPRPETKDKFGEFITDIRDKLTNGLVLGVASVLKRHPAAEAELPEFFKGLELATTVFRLVLIINGHKTDWLPPLQDALRRALHSTTQTWALGANAVVVLNEHDAKRFGLISAP